MRGAYSIFEQIKSDYIRYYESPFALSDDGLQRERKALLETEGNVYREPYIEVLPPFESSERTVEQACAELGLPKELASLSACGLFPSDKPLYEHQFLALKQASGGQHAVITSGTGSGKTEAFFLPIVSSLVTESAQWSRPSGRPETNYWWDQDRPSWRPGRTSERRPQAVRALVLYPLNALVEDQLRRLRAALDSSAAHDWYGRERGRQQILFRPLHRPNTGSRPFNKSAEDNRTDREDEKTRKSSSSGNFKSGSADLFPETRRQRNDIQMGHANCAA